MKMDPSARKMSDYQWQQAYAAYKRVRGHRTEDRQEADDSATPFPLPVTDNRVLVLRQNTAYPQVRKHVDWFFYALLILLAVVFLTFGIGTLIATDSQPGSFFIFLPQLIIWGGLAFVLRQLAHVLIDIPDIALRKCSEADPEDTLED